LLLQGTFSRDGALCGVCSGDLSVRFVYLNLGLVFGLEISIPSFGFCRFRVASFAGGAGFSSGPPLLGGVVPDWVSSPAGGDGCRWSFTVSCVCRSLTAMRLCSSAHISCGFPMFGIVLLAWKEKLVPCLGGLWRWVAAWCFDSGELQCSRVQEVKLKTTTLVCVRVFSLFFRVLSVIWGLYCSLFNIISTLRKKKGPLSRS